MFAKFSPSLILISIAFWFSPTSAGQSPFAASADNREAKQLFLLSRQQQELTRQHYLNPLLPAGIPVWNNRFDRHYEDFLSNNYYENSWRSTQEQRCPVCEVCPVTPKCPTSGEPVVGSTSEPERQLIDTCSPDSPTYTTAKEGNITIKFSSTVRRCVFNIVGVLHTTDTVTVTCTEKHPFSTFYINGVDPPIVGPAAVNKVYPSLNNYLELTLTGRFSGNYIKCNWAIIEDPTKVRK